ncbi:hypothetical protein VNO80_26683 [Phaseolus coccineus]|uniref:Peptidase A1 domain-containing protein n=1 Tax=Phaseolus coccineus TaxID=3886 RepID=A0AAN9LFB1_PHACN
MLELDALPPIIEKRVSLFLIFSALFGFAALKQLLDLSWLVGVYLNFLNMNPFLFFCLAVYSVSSLFSTEANESPSGFTVDLIHRDSPLSPFYNPSLTPSQRIINAALRSISRVNRVSNLLDQNNELPQSVLLPDHGEYLMRFFIGTPPVERLAIADTGSDLIWVQCSPCASCFPQNTPLFQPLKSSTFVATTCASQPCTLLSPGGRHCGKSGECIYTYQYGDDSFSAGLLSTETLSFDSQGGAQTVAFPNSFFGCGLYNNFTVYSSDKHSGVMGLGAGPLSLVSQIGDQIGHKFSYCLLPFSSTSTSKLKFGNEAVIRGNGVVSTPMIIKPSLPTYYFLNLESVSIAEKTMPTGSTDGGNVIIDSGTVLTYLEQTFYHNFAASLQESLGVELVQDIPSPLHFCFPYRDNFAFPEIVFQFSGASVSLKPINLLHKLEGRNMLCLMIAPSPVKGISIFGSFSQFDFQVEYDLEGKKVSFHPTDCSKGGSRPTEEAPKEGSGRRGKKTPMPYSRESATQVGKKQVNVTKSCSNSTKSAQWECEVQPAMLTASLGYPDPKVVQKDNKVEEFEKSEANDKYQIMDIETAEASMGETGGASPRESKDKRRSSSSSNVHTPNIVDS